MHLLTFTSPSLPKLLLAADASFSLLLLPHLLPPSSNHNRTNTKTKILILTMASEAPAVGIPDDVASMWKTLDPAVRAALIASESKDAEDNKKEASVGGAEGRRAKASSGPRMDDTTANLIGGDSFVKRTANPQWIKVRSDVYDAVKDRRQKELDSKAPVDIEVTLPDGKTLSEDKVSY